VRDKKINHFQIAIKKKSINQRTIANNETFYSASSFLLPVSCLEYENQDKRKNIKNRISIPL